MDYRYRVNYGNGQVSEDKSREDAVRELAECRRGPYGGFARVERYEPGTADSPGEWVTTQL